jgi:hypothetical protein
MSEQKKRDAVKTVRATAFELRWFQASENHCNEKRRSLMATAAAQEERFALYLLEGAFDSSAGQAGPGESTPMSCYELGGKQPDGVWTRLGRKSVTLKIDSPMRLSLFDTAKNPATLDEVVLNFSSIDPLGPPSPFGSESVITVEPDDVHDLDNPVSRLLPVEPTAGWKVSSQSVVNKGRFNGTVEVYVTTSEGRRRTFTIDPEMIVDGG